MDERTRQEIYDLPFRASVRAGVGAVMASYNRVNSRSCLRIASAQCHVEKAVGIQRLGHERLGGDFQHGGGHEQWLIWTCIVTHLPANNITTAIQSGNVPASELDGMVTRILTTMFQFGLFDNPPTGNLNSTVTNSANIQFARNAAAEGTVLLQNNGGLLPLGSSVHSIAVIGSVASVAPISAGGGSASVNLPYNITPLAGITSRAGGGVTVNYAQGDGASFRQPRSNSQQFRTSPSCVLASRPAKVPTAPVFHCPTARTPWSAPWPPPIPTRLS